MGCGGFTCLKNALCALNVVYMYMVILFLVFLFQFGVSCSCLALNKTQQEKLLNATWASMTNQTKEDLEKQLNCCGLLNDMNIQKERTTCRAECIHANKCETCGDLMLRHAGEALKILGGVGLFFSFTEILGVWLAIRYRNQKDPRANPSAFL